MRIEPQAQRDRGARAEGERPLERPLFRGRWYPERSVGTIISRPKSRAGFFFSMRFDWTGLGLGLGDWLRLRGLT